MNPKEYEIKIIPSDPITDKLNATIENARKTIENAQFQRQQYCTMRSNIDFLKNKLTETAKELAAEEAKLANFLIAFPV